MTINTVVKALQRFVLTRRIRAYDRRIADFERDFERLPQYLKKYRYWRAVLIAEREALREPRHTHAIGTRTRINLTRGQQ